MTIDRGTGGWYAVDATGRRSTFGPDNRQGAGASVGLYDGRTISEGEWRVYRMYSDFVFFEYRDGPLGPPFRLRDIRKPQPPQPPLLATVQLQRARWWARRPWAEARAIAFEPRSDLPARQAILAQSLRPRIIDWSPE